ncbi:MAG: hypothetical protein EU544_03900 [Promethearchaeota archaeon]|nr:MAG: hypothetical protein EU544_03900 [Candidatus Lokiarchaeota archaeon]
MQYIIKNFYRFLNIGMSISNIPSDVLGLALQNLLAPLLEEDKFQDRVKKLDERIVVLELEDIYPVSLVFKEGGIVIEYGERPKYNVKISITLDAFVGIAEGKVSLIGAVLRRKLKIKKLYHLFTVFKFYRILFPAIQKANEQPILEDLINIL